MALFTVSIQHMVSLTSHIHHNASTYPMKLRLQCSSPLQNYGFHGFVLDFDESGEALEMVKV
jgi:hypothetical protein